MQIYNKKILPDEPILSSGQINLRIMGFMQQGVVSVEAIVKAIDHLPGFHLQNLREILFAPELAPLPYGYGIEAYARQMQPSQKAEFIQTQRRIVFYDIPDATLFEHILYHEIAHHVFFLVLGSKVKKEWTTEISPGSVRATHYAGQSASEDFAESYACYVRDPEFMQQFPRKYAFMREKVFSGRAGTLKEKG